MAIDYSQASVWKEQYTPHPKLAKIPAIDSYEGTGNITVNTTSIMREVFLTNDSDTVNITARFLGPAGYDISFTLLPGDSLEERLFDFTQIILTTTGAWRMYVRSARIP